MIHIRLNSWYRTTVKRLWRHIGPGNSIVRYHLGSMHWCLHLVWMGHHLWVLLVHRRVVWCTIWHCHRIRTWWGWCHLSWRHHWPRVMATHSTLTVHIGIHLKICKKICFKLNTQRMLYTNMLMAKIGIHIHLSQRRLLTVKKLL